MSRDTLLVAALAVGAVFLAGCGGGGGGGGGDGDQFSEEAPGANPAPAPTAADAEVRSGATRDSTGGVAQMDVIDGGLPPGFGDAADPLSAAKAALWQILRTKSGGNLDGRVTDGNGDLIPDGGFEAYETGIPTSVSTAGRIFLANNIYDMIQSVTGSPRNVTQPAAVNGSAGGPGLLANVLSPTTNGQAAGGTPIVWPVIPSLPNGMGDAVADGSPGSRRGPSPTDQHQFVQIELPYALDTSSLFDPTNVANSFLGDRSPPVGLGNDNVEILGHAVQQVSVSGADTIAIQRDVVPWHVKVIAIVGGVTSIPSPLGGQTIVDPAHFGWGFVPAGARDRALDPNVLTLIAHESPETIPSEFFSPLFAGPGAFVDASAATVSAFGSAVLVLPDPTTDGGGGRVFGGAATIQVFVPPGGGGGSGTTTAVSHAHPGSVNDYSVHSDTAAAFIGFFNVNLKWVRTSTGSMVDRPYFHTYDMSQAQVGNDPRAPFHASMVRSFTRGPAIAVNNVTQLPSIDIKDRGKGTHTIGSPNLSPATDDPNGFDGDNIISTRTRFLVEFDREVVPNSVGFSRRHTLHSHKFTGDTVGTVVFPFNGNTRPVRSPVDRFVANVESVEGSPLATSIYLAINQPVNPNLNAPLTGPRKTNDPIQLGVVAGTITGTNGLPTDDNGADLQPGQNGLDPVRYNTLATLPRAPVPVDIYPLNQNNLQAYVVEPLVEMPPGAVVTLGVCVQGLNQTGSITGPSGQLGHTNRGNYTRSGTLYTPFQGLTPTGLGSATSSVVAVVGDKTLIKVNAGPMDFKGNLFYGGTIPSINTLINGGIPGPGSVIVDDDFITGGYNVSRSWRVGQDHKRVYVNAPVSPMALYPVFTNGGMGVLDLSGTGFNTNAPGGAQANTTFKNYLITSRLLPPVMTGKLTAINWNTAGAFPSDHAAAFGRLSRYTSGGAAFGTPPGTESEHAVASPIRTGGLTPTPGINEGSSGFETLVRNSKGQQDLLTGSGIGVISDVVLGDFLDTVFFDPENAFNGQENHRTILETTATISNNTISDPPLPNPPPLRYPVGLPHTAVIFDQEDLTQAPRTIEGNECFTTDAFVEFNAGGGGVITGSAPINTFIQLNPVGNSSNPNTNKDIPPLPNSGFTEPFSGFGAFNWKFVQTGPMPKTSTAPVIALAANFGAGSANSIVAPGFSSRQQIGNFVFTADRTSKRVHALNSNTMEVLDSVKLPDPYGLGLTSDLRRLFVTNEGDDSVSLVDVDPRSDTFMTELKRTKLVDPDGGSTGPRAIAVAPDQEDAIVLGFANNSVNVLQVPTAERRKLIKQNGISRPWDVCIGMDEVAGAPAFQSGTYHAFISNNGGNDVLVYEGGPSGLGGYGFDTIIGSVKPNVPPNASNPNFKNMLNPKGIVYDPISPVDSFAGTIGCFVAHQDAATGNAMVSRISYSKDDSPGQNFITEINPNAGFGQKVFEVISQYNTVVPKEALDVALIDYNRKLFEQETWGTFANLFNSGAVLVQFQGVNMPRNAKYPITGLSTSGTATNNPRWNPDRLYLSIAGGQIAAFDVFNPAQPPRLIATPGDVKILASYFSQ